MGVPKKLNTASLEHFIQLGMINSICKNRAVQHGLWTAAGAGPQRRFTDPGHAVMLDWPKIPMQSFYFCRTEKKSQKQSYDCMNRRRKCYFHRPQPLHYALWFICLFKYRCKFVTVCRWIRCEAAGQNNKLSANKRRHTSSTQWGFIWL